MAGIKGLADKAKQFLSKNPDKTRQSVDRAAGFIDDKTGGKHRQHIDKAAERAKDYVGREGESQERRPGGGEQGPQGQQPPH